ncbi:MAG: DoxX family membrane protein [Bacteroidales bacterium]|nr:DoxX family membrane protein [Bacteroidales bacterium]MCB8998580.1 DoxX family membrane protein [Bacteroidales bacterium]MCB9012552.1 DoxX family membrane protein [Bacteroidales bacterium]
MTKFKSPANYWPILLTLVRIAIGWQFLYEGIVKLNMSGWSSAPYLSGSKWILAPFFHWMAANPAITSFVDFLNIWGLILAGLGLMLGLFARWASLGGAIMLLFYFSAYPPIPGYMQGIPIEGNYLWVNKTLIEFFIVSSFIFISSSKLYGIDRIYRLWKDEKARQPVSPVSDPGKEGLDRREVLKNLISVPAIGAFAYAFYRKKKWDSFEEKLLNMDGIDANSGATLLKFNYSSLSDLKGQLPTGAIKYTDENGNPANFELSRLFMGGNLIGGWAHARDLIYVSKLVKTYHTDEKVLQTLALGEKCGMNAIIANPQLGRILQKYRHEFKGKMKFISDCGTNLDFLQGIKLSVAANFDAMYCQGEITDRWTDAAYDDGTGKTLEQRMEIMKQGLEEIRRHGKPAGIGAHRIEAIKVCVNHGLKPDFWVKTSHDHSYWSAQNTGSWKDNIFDFDPGETVRYMATLEEPWIAFKVLAAGAIKPEDGLKYAFMHGADFVCMGMYDFQIVEDVNIALDTLDKLEGRTRAWMA